MSSNSNVITLRLSDEELAAIDQRIGLDGVKIEAIYSENL